MQLMTKMPIIIGLLLISAIIYLFPVISNPNMLLNRNNDLENFFLARHIFTKHQIISNHQIPLWNNLFFSGMPFISDPQSLLFYPFSILSLVTPNEFFFVFQILLHLLIGSLGIYMLCRNTFKLTPLSSLFAAIFYIVSPKLAGFLEAGHLGLLYATTWYIWVLYSYTNLLGQKNLSRIILVAIFLSLIFYTHTIIFLISVITIALLFLIQIPAFKKQITKTALFTTLVFIFTFGLTAITLLPQLEWAGISTRFLLTQNPDVYPKWSSKFELLQTMFVPLSVNTSILQQLDSEKWIPLGTFLTITSILGFYYLNKKLKAYYLLLTTFVMFISLNNASPLYTFLITQDWYALLRVSTRFWFLLLISSLIISAYFLDILVKKKRLLLAIAFFLLITGESLFLSWIKIYNPINRPSQLTKEDLQPILNDKSRYRIFCLDKCISQKTAAESNIELIEGYNTLQQLNYYKHSWQLTQSYWNYYTLSIPPLGLIHSKTIQPRSQDLSEYNTKYVISLYPLKDGNFKPLYQAKNYTIFLNPTFKPRAYYHNDPTNKEARITSYTSNSINIDTTDKFNVKLMLAEVYSPGWKAYLNGKKEVPIQETPSALRLVDLESNTNFVTFVYKPISYQVGKFISIFTLIFILYYFSSRRLKSYGKNQN